MRRRGFSSPPQTPAQALQPSAGPALLLPATLSAYQALRVNPAASALAAAYDENGEDSFRHTGDADWPAPHYLLNLRGTVAPSDFETISADHIYCMPFLSGRGGTLDRFGPYVNTGAANNAKVGIYATKSKTNLYPGSRLLDGGAVSLAAAGAALATVSQALVEGQLYWAAFLLSGNTILKCIQNSEQHVGVMGCKDITASLVQNHMLVKLNHGYGNGLPATFPTGAGLYDTDTKLPLVVGRFSA